MISASLLSKDMSEDLQGKYKHVFAFLQFFTPQKQCHNANYFELFFFTTIQSTSTSTKETKKQNAKIRDEIAVELVEKLDYDFSMADKDNAMNYGVIARTIVLDRMVEQYLKKHEN